MNINQQLNELRNEISNDDAGRNFFEKEEAGYEWISSYAGNFSDVILYGVMGIILVYTGYHGIHASLMYTDNTTASIIAQVVGIAINELVLLGLMMGLVSGKIQWGTSLKHVQSWVALIAISVGLGLVAVATIADSWINNSHTLTPFLAWYMQWGLIVSPIVMSVLAFLVKELSPEQSLRRERVEAKLSAERAKNHALVAWDEAMLSVQKAKANLLLNSAMQNAKLIEASYNRDDVQSAITRRAEMDTPTLLRGAGFDVEMVNGIQAFEVPTGDDVGTMAAAPPRDETWPQVNEVDNTANFQ